MKIDFPRMWAQLRLEQGNTKSKRKLEEEYRKLQPNDQQEWERQVRRFINNNSDSDGHPVASQNSAPQCENEVIESSSGCETERRPNSSQHHEPNMHADASAPSLSVLEGDFSIDQHTGIADVSDTTSSIEDRIIAELLEFHQTNGRWPRDTPCWSSGT